MTYSEALFATAQKYIPGGVNSPVRAFNGVGGHPLFISSAKGAYLFDADNNSYIDYVGSWGPMIAGHAHAEILRDVALAMRNGLSFGAPTALEVQLAKTVCTIMPAIEQIRFVNSGTEAAMSAIRLARGFTGRSKIIKFAGCYHGHADSLLVAAGSGALTLGVANSLGVTQGAAADTLVAEYNRLESVERLFAKYGDDIAGIIIEPVAGNMNCVLPVDGFLQDLRKLCDQYGALFIIDEVMTGFRVALGGAQAHYGVTPDLTVLGKIIGGGLPVGAFGGRKDIMQCLAPVGGVYQAGTLSGNPIAMTAGLATLNIIQQPGFYEALGKTTAKIVTGLSELAQAANIPFYTQYLGGMFGIFFTHQEKIETEQDVKQCNVERFKQFFHGMLKEGVYFAPSAFEAGFVSAAHGEGEIEKTLAAAEKVFKTLKA